MLIKTALHHYCRDIENQDLEGHSRQGITENGLSEDIKS